MDSDGISQGAAKAGEFDVHDVAIQEFDAVAEAEDICAEEMNVNVTGPAVSGIFEMVMFEVGDRVRHVLLPGCERFGPDRVA